MICMVLPANQQLTTIRHISTSKHVETRYSRLYRTSPPCLHRAVIVAAVDPHDAGCAVEERNMLVARHAGWAGEFRPSVCSNLV